MGKRESIREDIGYSAIVRAPRYVTLDRFDLVEIRPMSPTEGLRAARNTLNEIKDRHSASDPNRQDPSSIQHSEDAA